MKIFTIRSITQALEAVTLGIVLAGSRHEAMIKARMLHPSHAHYLWVRSEYESAAAPLAGS